MSPAGNVWDAALTGRGRGIPQSRDRGQYARIPRIRSVNRNASQDYKPTTPGRRGMSVMDYSGLSKVEPEKSLLAP